jgi:hypothetical protein
MLIFRSFALIEFGHFIDVIRLVDQSIEFADEVVLGAICLWR